MSEEVIKILTAIIIFAVAVGAGLLPLRMGATKRGDVILMLGLAFAGGVFLAGGLVHLLVDGMESFEELGMGEGFPLAFAICGLGLLAVLLFEKVAAAGTEESTAVSASGRQPYLLLIVLSAHSVIAGASLGLQTSGSAFLMILLAILAHKGFAAFSLGVSFMRGGLAPAVLPPPPALLRLHHPGRPAARHPRLERAQRHRRAVVRGGLRQPRRRHLPLRRDHGPHARRLRGGQHPGAQVRRLVRRLRADVDAGDLGVR